MSYITDMNDEIGELKAENAKLKQALARVEADNRQLQLIVNSHANMRDTAQAQLLAAAHLLERATSVGGQPALASDILSFLAKYEDRHAQGAQAIQGSSS